VYINIERIKLVEVSLMVN